MVQPPPCRHRCKPTRVNHPPVSGAFRPTGIPLTYLRWEDCTPSSMWTFRPQKKKRRTGGFHRISPMDFSTILKEFPRCWEWNENHGVFLMAFFGRSSALQFQNVGCLGKSVSIRKCGILGAKDSHWWICWPQVSFKIAPFFADTSPCNYTLHDTSVTQPQIMLQILGFLTRKWSVSKLMD